MGNSKLKIYMVAVVGLLAVISTQSCFAFTDSRDILAINSLYAALGFPPLVGWLLAGGDPCLEGWQGVQCLNSNITGIVLNDANLGGELVVNLGTFASITQIDLSNNHIGGSIPSNLPVTLKTFFLSGNQLTGSIPESLSTLGLLTDLSLNNNHLSGAIPDSFQQLLALANLDLSANNLSGPMPPSMARLSSISTLHLEDNQLTGVLDVLQDLPLIDLDIENNLFSGPIPPKLLGIPNFRSKGNPFNTTIIPSPPAESPLPASTSEAQPPGINPVIQARGPSSSELPHSSGQQKSNMSKKVVWIAVGGFFILVLLALGLCVRMSKWYKEKSTVKVGDHMKSSILNLSSSNPSHPKETQRIDSGRHNSLPRSNLEEDQKIQTISKNPPPTLPPQPLAGEGVIVKPVAIPTTTVGDISKNIHFPRFFSVASLQHYTNSFSQENLIGNGMLGSVYKAELPNGKVVAVKKLENATLRQWSDEDFIGLVSNVSKLQNDNIVGLEGYCLEHGQRLFIYEYCKNGTLHDALHLDEKIHEKLSWNARVHLALQAAKALEYLHEFCQPLVVHQNFKSANILLDEELNVRVSDCGLASLLPSSYTSQLQGLGYGAPELESGSYTYQSDVYSFGIVMLELLTGRKAFDRSKPRGEQYLVRWAVPRLHDIDALSRMVDPSLDSAYSSKSISRFADIISLCVQAEPEFRPPMSEIVQNLLHMTKINL
ncbi:leucine-rich repeat protein kinase family protein [Artemisia annua]|uniref:Leucine-rich repeat protein kinase family protein n=1 Tax=Artemisia annua TaxID=35608 RepID=A0A2U1QAB9_ARTAN|nr:leucine-rich repeat protein kinase family protein [Artemisia annua]